jgi:benzodiazapine receptor
MKKLLLILMPLFFIGMLAVNYLSATGRINHISAGGVSGLHPTYFTPAGFTFSIWGIIYLFNILFIIYALIKHFTGQPDYPSEKIISLYLLSCLVNIVWIFAWHYQDLIFAMILMLIFLFILILLYLEVTSRSRRTVFEYFATVTPVSLYLSWIVVAAVANGAVTLASLQWNGFGIGGQYWASIMICIAGIINILILIRKKDIFFNLVFLWAVTGIISARRAEMSPESNIVANTALIMMGIVFILILITRFVHISKEKRQGT